MLDYGDDNVERTVRVPMDHIELEGTLGVPADAAGVVLFAHGSGSSRFSSRNRYVARVLREAGFATLLIVGGDDEPVIELNERAKGRMRTEVRLEIIPGATHLFEEPGALEAVARLARHWFARHLATSSAHATSRSD